MGWTFTHGASKSDIIENLTRRQENDKGVWTCERPTVRGCHLWLILVHFNKETGETRRAICLFLLGTSNDGDWGYKGMDETSHPYFYDCPLSLLDACPLDPSLSEHGRRNATEWRKRVRQHAKDNNVGRKLQVGATYELQNVSSEWKGRHIRITSLRPLRGEVGQMPVRFKRKQIGAKVK